jgi:hypothetical protein
MSTTSSPVSPSNVSDSNKYVISHPVTDPNPSKTALQVGVARNEYQHSLVNISRGKIGGGKNKNKKNKKSKKYTRKSVMKKRFSKKFRRSILKRKSRKMRVRKTSLYGGSTVNNSDKLTIPSFRQASPTGTGIINQLAGNHAQTLAYSAYDNQVSKPASV